MTYDASCEVLTTEPGTAVLTRQAVTQVATPPPQSASLVQNVMGLLVQSFGSEPGGRTHVAPGQSESEVQRWLASLLHAAQSSWVEVQATAGALTQVSGA